MLISGYILAQFDQDVCYRDNRESLFFNFSGKI